MGRSSMGRLDEYASFIKKIIESQTTELNTDTSKSKTSETVGKTNEVNIEKPKSVHESVVSKPMINRDKVIIEDWNSDDEDDVSAVKTVSPSPEPKMKTVVNNGQRVVKPVWDNAKRVNQQKISNNLKYHHSRRSYVSSRVLTRTGLVNPVRPNRKRAVHTVSTARPISTARPVSTARVKNMTTVGTRTVVNTGKGKMDNDLKKSRWVWRPKGNYMDHESKEKGSFILKSILQDYAVVDSGCFSHMTGNKAYLSDYKDYNRGFIAFGSYPKGGALVQGRLKATYGAELISAASLVNTARPTLSIARLSFMNWGEVNPTRTYYNGSCTSKDTEDPSWSTSFKTRRTRKTSSALEDFICVVFVHDRNIRDGRMSCEGYVMDYCSSIFINAIRMDAYETGYDSLQRRKLGFTGAQCSHLLSLSMCLIEDEDFVKRLRSTYILVLGDDYISTSGEALAL
ncbi:hypothetical protein Tco_1417685 [Tanacetum coccineum]